jgi:hypothetical protein
MEEVVSREKVEPLSLQQIKVNFHTLYKRQLIEQFNNGAINPHYSILKGVGRRYMHRVLV